MDHVPPLAQGWLQAAALIIVLVGWVRRPCLIGKSSSAVELVVLKLGHGFVLLPEGSDCSKGYFGLGMGSPHSPLISGPLACGQKPPRGCPMCSVVSSAHANGAHGAGSTVLAPAARSWWPLHPNTLLLVYLLSMDLHFHCITELSCGSQCERQGDLVAFEKHWDGRRSSVSPRL